MDLLYFVILVSSLIFVHELGHFLFAKAFGVKVLTFSLGFGPKVLKLRGRETEYCISLLPLGGYVKMLEASKTDVVWPEDRKRTFESLPVFKRVVIVLAGPVMNLIFPVLLYFAVFVSDGPFLPPTIGIVLPNHAADGKLRPGDRIMSIDDQEVGTWDEVKRIIAASPAKLLKLKVFRDNRHVDVEVTTEETVERRGADVKQANLDITQRIGTLGIQPSAPQAVIGVPNPDSPGYRAGLRTFDVITNVGGVPVRRFMDLTNALSENAGETLPVTYLRPVSVPGALGGLADMAVFESGVVALTPDPSGSSLLERTGIELADLYLAFVPPDSYLYQAGLRPGDKILRLDEEPVPAWYTFAERVKAAPDKQHRLDYQAARDGRVRTGSFQIRREDYKDDGGQVSSRYIFLQQQWIPVAADERVEHPTPIRYAFTKAVEETVNVTRFTMVCLVRLLQGRLSLKSLSGPIAIYEVAGQEGRKGPDFFVWVMALLSINLGLLNLLPIPVLDGGHLMFFAIEGVLRKPLPLRTREIAHIIGMALLFGLMAMAFKNDVEKRWDVIRGQIGGISG